MTSVKRRQWISDRVSALKRMADWVPLMRRSESRLDTTSAEGQGKSTNRDVLEDRGPRLRLLAGTAFGVGCLLLAQWLQPEGASPYAAPVGWEGWMAVILGVVGFWLVPGQWLSAVTTRTGADPAVWLATRIGTTLGWYAIVGAIIHQLAQGARVTPGGIIGATVAVTGSVCLGLILGLLRWPANPRHRILLAAVAGSICAQSALALSMHLWRYGVNYEHIRRLDWLIVLGCAFLTTVGMQSRLELPSMRTTPHMRHILVVLPAIAITAVAVVATGVKWSPAQRMPSAFGAEQIAGSAGADVALILTPIGPEGTELIQRAVFTAADDSGHPVAIRTQTVGDPRPDGVTLLVEIVLDPGPTAATYGVVPGGTLPSGERYGMERQQLVPGPIFPVQGLQAPQTTVMSRDRSPEPRERRSRTVLCERAVPVSEPSIPIKLTLHDQTSGLLVQANLPPGWCAG
ncbi:hypothetical protein NWP13_10280 [Rhodococcus pyridinivorans]|nr:hypothetical protein [Rhodococcus pyridinivorans]